MKLPAPEEFIIRLRLIGAVEAVDSAGRNVLPHSRLSHALISYLALNAGKWVTRANIAKLLWEDVSEKPARANLRQTLHELRRSLGPLYPEVIETDRKRIRLRCENIWVDALAIGDEGSNCAVELGGARLLDDLDNLSSAFDAWLTTQRQTFEQRVGPSNVLATPSTSADQILLARSAVAVDPTNEKAVRELMRILADCGQDAQALLEYERCRAVLQSRLQLDPTYETQELHRELERGAGLQAAKKDSPLLHAQGRHLNRQIRAVLLVDIVDSVRLIAEDEAGTVDQWLSIVEEVKAEVLPRLSGRLVKSLGDGMLLEFPDVQSAAAAAFDIQACSRKRNSSRAAGREILLRMGIEVGVIIVGDNDVYGHSVNVAARLMTTLARPGEIVVSAHARDQLVPVLDADVEDLGECYLKNIEGPVRAYRIGPPGLQATPAPYALRALLPSIAVIPFAARTSSPDHQVLGEILADELINALSRSHNIDVISRLSTTVFRVRTASIGEIGKHLNANYVLSGVYRTDSESIVIDLELSDVRSERIIWNERLTGRLSGLFNGELELLLRIAADVYSAIVSQELKRARAARLPTLESYTLLLSAISLMHRMSLRDFARSRDMLLAIIDRGARQAVPQAWLAKWYVLRIQQGWTDDVRRDTAEAVRCASQALEEDPNSSLALAIDGLVHTHMTKRHDIAEERYSLAVRSNPNDALAWLLKGTQHAFVGDGEQAVNDTQRALRLSPLDPHSYYFHSLSASAQITAGNNKLALHHAELSLRTNKVHTSTLRVKAVAQWRLGLEQEARATGAELLRLEPNLTVTGWLKRSPTSPYANGQAFAETLAKIGIPN